MQSREKATPIQASTSSTPDGQQVGSAPVSGTGSGENDEQLRKADVAEDPFVVASAIKKFLSDELRSQEKRRTDRKKLVSESQSGVDSTGVVDGWFGITDHLTDDLSKYHKLLELSNEREAALNKSLNEITKAEKAYREGSKFELEQLTRNLNLEILLKEKRDYLIRDQAATDGAIETQKQTAEFLDKGSAIHEGIQHTLVNSGTAVISSIAGSPTGAAFGVALAAAMNTGVAIKHVQAGGKSLTDALVDAGTSTVNDAVSVGAVTLGLKVAGAVAGSLPAGRNLAAVKLFGGSTTGAVNALIGESFGKGWQYVQALRDFESSEEFNNLSPEQQKIRWEEKLEEQRLTGKQIAQDIGIGAGTGLISGFIGANAAIFRESAKTVIGQASTYVAEAGATTLTGLMGANARADAAGRELEFRDYVNEIAGATIGATVGEVGAKFAAKAYRSRAPAPPPPDNSLPIDRPLTTRADDPRSVEIRRNIELGLETDPVKTLDNLEGFGLGNNQALRERVFHDAYRLSPGVALEKYSRFGLERLTPIGNCVEAMPHEELNHLHSRINEFHPDIQTAAAVEALRRKLDSMETTRAFATIEGNDRLAWAAATLLRDGVPDTVEHFPFQKISSVKLLGELALIAAQADPYTTTGSFSRFIPNHCFRLQPEEFLPPSQINLPIEFERAIVQLTIVNPRGTAGELFTNSSYTLDNESALRIARRFAEVDESHAISPTNTYFIRDLEGIRSIYDIYVGKSASQMGDAFGKFGIEIDRSELVEKSGAARTRQLRRLTSALSASERTELATALAGINPFFACAELPTLVDPSSPHFARILRICAETDPLAVLDGIVLRPELNPRQRTELAEICARQKPALTAELISRFNLENEHDRFTVALAVAETDALISADSFGHFHIFDQALIARVAETAARHPTTSPMQIFDLYKLQESHLGPVLDALVETQPPEVVDFQQQLGISNPKHWKEVMLRCVRADANAAESLPHQLLFSRPDGLTQTDIHELMIEAARQSGESVLAQLPNLNVTDSTVIETITFEAGKSSIKAVQDRHPQLFEKFVSNPDSVAEWFRSALELGNYANARDIYLAANESPLARMTAADIRARIGSEKLSATVAAASKTPSKLRELRQLQTAMSEVPELRVPWQESLERIEALQAQAARAKYDPWKRSFDPLVERAISEGLLNPMVPADSEILRTFVQNYGMHDSPRLLRWHAAIERARSVTEIAPETLRDIEQFLRARSPARSPKELTTRLREAYRDMRRALLDDQHDIPYIHSDIGREMFKGLRGLTEWYSGDDAGRVLDTWKRTLTRKPHLAELPDGYRETEILVDPAGSSRRVGDDTTRSVPTAKEILTNRQLESTVSNLRSAHQEAQRITDLRTWWNQRRQGLLSSIVEQTATIDAKLAGGTRTQAQKAGLTARRTELERIRAQLEGIEIETGAEAVRVENISTQLETLNEQIPTRVKERAEILRALSAQQINLLMPEPQRQSLRATLRSANSADGVLGLRDHLIEFVDQHYLTTESVGEQTNRPSFSPALLRTLRSVWELNDGLDANSIVRSGKRLQQIEAAAQASSAPAGKPVKISMVPVRGALKIYSGDLGDACFTHLHDEFAAGRYAEITPYVFVTGRNTPTEQLAGSVLAIETRTPEGEPVLKVRGNNPKQNLIAALDSESFVNSVLKEMIDLAARRNIKYVVVPLDNASESSSNREPVSETYEHKFGSQPKLQLENSAVTNFNGYNNWFRRGQHPVVVVWQNPNL